MTCKSSVEDIQTTSAGFDFNGTGMPDGREKRERGEKRKRGGGGWGNQKLCYFFLRLSNSASSMEV